MAGICLVLGGTYWAHRMNSPLFLKPARVPVGFSLGIACGVSAAINRPITIYLTPPGRQHQKTFRATPEEIRNSPGKLRGHEIVALYWGLGLLLIVGKELILALLLSVDMFVTVNGITSYLLIGLLVVGPLS